MISKLTKGSFVFSALSIYSFFFALLTLFVPASVYADTIVTGNITTNTTWGTSGNSYIIENPISISSGVTLTINPGVIVKFRWATTTLTVNGTLNASGSAASPIYLTSNNDNTVGGTASGSNGSPVGGDWEQITVSNTGSTTLSYVVVRDGGNSAGSQTNILNNGGILNISNATTSGSYNVGLWNNAGTTTCTSGCNFTGNWTSFYLTGGTATVSSSKFYNNGYFGAFGSGSGSLTLSNNTFYDNNLYGASYIYYASGLNFTHSSNTSSKVNGPNGINGFMTNDHFDRSQTWTSDTMPYVVYPYTNAPLSIDSGYTLTINPGVVVKFATSRVRTRNT